MIRLITILLFLILTLSASKYPYARFYYIQDYNKLIEFIDSAAVIESNNCVTKLKLKSTGDIACEIYLDTIFVEAGLYRKSDDFHEQTTVVPLPGSKSKHAFIDTTICFPIYKKSGNWIWPFAGANVTYFDGTEVTARHNIVHINPLKKDLLLTMGSGEFQIKQDKFIFRANSTNDTIQYWKISGYSDWKTGYLVHKNQHKKTNQKAIHHNNGYEKVIQDSIFITPLYDWINKE